MEIYRAVCEFNPPRGENDSSDNNILSFEKGDRFEVLDSNKRSIEWWGARALKDNSVGYVPSKYLKYEERKVGKLNSETDHKILREKSLKRLADIRQSAEYKPPDELYPDIPSPDYDSSSDEEENELNNSISKNGSLETSLNALSDDEFIEDVCPALPEPDPDYLCEEDDSLDSAVLRAGRQDVTIIQVGNRNHSGSTALDYDDNRMTSDLHRIRHSSDSDGQGLILPKKLPNPCLDSKERTELHRELLMNNKLGKNVLKKSELQKKLTEREDLRRKKEWEEYKALKRTSLEMKLEERANRLKEEEAKTMKPISEETTNRSEFSKVHAKITARACEN